MRLKSILVQLKFKLMERVVDIRQLEETMSIYYNQWAEKPPGKEICATVVKEIPLQLLEIELVEMNMEEAICRLRLEGINICVMTFCSGVISFVN